ncbi:MAG: hypothetical protein M5U34_38105 [Chloroflexi bacterium]|nr:hypothetical protein [Chloroflexota bacterium]
MNASDNHNTETTLSPWLDSFGFNKNPFSMLYAENQSDDMLQETYYVTDEPDKLLQFMLDEDRHVAFLAPYGGGKTASCLYTHFRWQTGKPHAFITVFNNFTAVAEQLPDVTLNTHRAALVEAVADSFWTYIKNCPDKFLLLSRNWQVWWWSLLETYLPEESLYFRVNEVPKLVPSYENYKGEVGSGKEILPFQPNQQLPGILKAISNQLAKIGFTRWLIMVDEIDAEANHHIDDLSRLLKPHT